MQPCPAAAPRRDRHGNVRGDRGWERSDTGCSGLREERGLRITRRRTQAARLQLPNSPPREFKKKKRDRKGPNVTIFGHGSAQALP